MAIRTDSATVHAGRSAQHLPILSFPPSIHPLVESIVSERIIHVTDADFEEKVLQAGEPILVDFWAEWCGPCKMIGPILQQLADEYDGKLTVAKLNIDENPKIPQNYSVRGIPTLLLFKDGQEIARKVGAMPKSQLAAFVDANL